MSRAKLLGIVFTGIAGCLFGQTAPGPASNFRDGAPSWLLPAAQGNQVLPRWLRFDGQMRDRAEKLDGIGFKPKSDAHNLTQLRLMLIIQPSDWLKVVAETQDSRVFANSNVACIPPYQNTWDIRQAYVQLGRPTEGWFDVVAGRQVLSLGAERLVGPSDWSNMGRTFDLVRLNLHNSRFGLSLFSSSVIVARDGAIDHHLQGNNLHGAYGSLQRLIPRATVEPYLLWRVAPGNVRLNENAGRGALSEATLGVRVAGRLPGALEYDLEMARQTGSLGPYTIDSWAGHWNLARPLKLRLKPRPFVEANYASGTRDPAGRTWSTFDQLYPSNHNKFGFADQVGWRNMEQVRGGISESVGRRWKFNQTYENFWLASARDALYSAAGGVVAQSASGAAGRHVGQEVDFWAEWNWKDTLKPGFGYARFIPGTFLNRTTPGRSFNYPFVFLTYEFTTAKTTVK
jgi:hypothetical protein